MTKERLKVLLKNAITWIDEENSDFFASEVGDEYEWYKEALGITKKELLEIGVDWIQDAPEEYDDEEDDYDFTAEYYETKKT